jgi:hypothetical protein
MTPFGKEKQVFLIPYWIKNILERHKLTLATVLDLVKLRSITSAEDLALTKQLNLQNTAVFGVNNPEQAMSAHWLKTPESAYIYSQLEQLTDLYADGLEERLFNEKNLNSNYSKAFEIQDIDYDTFLITVYPGYFGSPKAAEYQNQLVHAYLKLWYGYSNYDVMARVPLFKRYLSQL